MASMFLGGNTKTGKIIGGGGITALIALFFRIGGRNFMGHMNNAFLAIMGAQAILKMLRNKPSEAPAKPQVSMEKKEAMEILGVTENSTELEIKESHKRLISKLHPDKGGSQHLASKVNAAKDILLKKGK